jgi:hypothetical protein
MQHKGISHKGAMSRLRNWEILQLRGLYASVGRLIHLDETARDIVKEAVEKRLRELNAETEFDRKNRLYREYCQSARAEIEGTL